MAIPNRGNYGQLIPTTKLRSEKELYDFANNVSSVINNKVDGLYPVGQEFMNGKTIIPNITNSSNPQPEQNIYHVYVNFGQLPNATSKSVPHNISGPFSLITVYGGATNTAQGANNAALPIGYPSPTLQDNISVSVDDTNVTITTGIDRTNFNETHIIIEFIKR